MPDEIHPNGLRETTDRTVATDELLEHVWRFPLFEAMFGRRSRRFAYGAAIPNGPLKYRSEKESLPLSEVEQSILIASAVGVFGRHFGVPYTPAEPGLSTYSLRFTGRPTPTAAGFGTVELFYTDDDGTYFVSTRDESADWPGRSQSVQNADELVAICRSHTTTVRTHRLDFPRELPHMDPHNHWNANVEGSTLFMPVADAGQQQLAFLIILCLNGIVVYDDFADCYAGSLEPYFESGTLDPELEYPLSQLDQAVLKMNSIELGIMGHNMVLALQAMGLGGFEFSGIDALSIMGASADEGVPGLGFRFQRNDDWSSPNPIGLDGHFESVCPPYYPDMYTAVESLVEKKFGSGGTYDPFASGPYRTDVTGTAERHPEEIVEVVGETAQYIYDTYGRFPATVPTIFMYPLVQAHHLDTDYYDTQFGQGSYLETHASHVEQWHPEFVS